MGGGQVSEFRARITASVTALWDGTPPALLFSGGTDSLTVLWSLLEVGARPTCYTFHLEGTRHADLVVSEQVAAADGLDHRVVTIPRNIKQLEADCRSIVNRFGTARKTHVQCLYPMLHIAPEVTEQQVFTGLNADDWWGSAKSDAINCAKDPEEFDKRRAKRQADPTTSGFAFWNKLFAGLGHELCCPYRDRALVRWMLSKTWPELMRPKQKQPAVEGYREEFVRHACYRLNDNLQCGSGIREWHDVLLSQPCNTRGRKSVAGLYRDMMEGRA